MREEGEELRTHSLAKGWSLARLRHALRSGDKSALNEAATPFYQGCCVALLRFCDGLLRRAALAGVVPAVDGTDIAAMAYERTLTLLAGPRGDKIQDESHLVRVLYISARCAYADTLRLPDTRQSRPQSDTLEDDPSDPAGTEESPEERLFGSSPAAVAAMVLLFADGAQFMRIMRESGAGARHYRQYRALVLYELGVTLRADLVGGEGNTGTANGHTASRQLWRRCATELFALDEEDWNQVEQAAMESVDEMPDTGGLYASLRDTVNAICSTDLHDRAKLAVLRHEMGKLLERRGTELWERGNFG